MRENDIGYMESNKTDKVARIIALIIVLAIGGLVSLIWIAVEIYTADTVDNNEKIIKKGKKLKDIFKRKK